MITNKEAKTHSLIISSTIWNSTWPLGTRMSHLRPSRANKAQCSSSVVEVFEKTLERGWTWQKLYARVTLKHSRQRYCSISILEAQVKATAAFCSLWNIQAKKFFSLVVPLYLNLKIKRNTLLSSTTHSLLKIWITSKVYYSSHRYKIFQNQSTPLLSTRLKLE